MNDIGMLDKIDDIWTLLVDTCNENGINVAVAMSLISKRSFAHTTWAGVEFEDEIIKALFTSAFLKGMCNQQEFICYMSDKYGGCQLQRNKVTSPFNKLQVEGILELVNGKKKEKCRYGSAESGQLYRLTDKGIDRANKLLEV